MRRAALIVVAVVAVVIVAVMSTLMWSAGVLGAVAFICAVIAWFGILFASQHPRGLWDMGHLYMRWRTRGLAYMMLLRDEYPLAKRQLGGRWRQQHDDQGRSESVSRHTANSSSAIHLNRRGLREAFGFRLSAFAKNR